MATVLTNTGSTFIRDNLTGTSVNAATTADFIGWGTGAGSSAKGDTILFAEASSGISMGGETRILATRSVSGIDVVQWVGTLTANSIKTVTNAGNFTGSTSAAPGNLVVHGDFAGISLSASDMIQLTIALQIS